LKPSLNGAVTIILIKLGSGIKNGVFFRYSSYFSGNYALVIKPSVLLNSYFINVETGMEVREIIAIPRVKFSKQLIKLLKTKGDSI